jgi:hypothetical protein
MASAPGAAGPGAKYPQWTVNTSGWVVAEVIDAAEKTLAEASVYPDTLVFFTSKSAADNYVKSKGGTPVTSPLAAAGGQAALNAGAAAVTAAANPLAALFQSSIWLRVAEAVAGLILLGIGLNAMLKGRPLSAVTSAAGAAGKVAMF